MPTAEEIAAMYDAAPAAGTPGLSADQIGAIYDSAPAPTTVGDVISGGVQNILSGITLGAGDELSAGVNAAIDAVGPGTFAEAYPQYLEKARGQRQAFRQAAGTPLAVTQDIGSAFLLPLKLFGAAKTVGQVAKTGAKLGAAYGFGEGEGDFYERAVNSALGAAIGGGAGATLATGAQGVGAALRSRLGQALIADLKRLGSGQRGAVSLGGQAEPQLTPAQLQLLDRVRTMDPTLLEAGIARLEAAQAQGVPLTLTEALENPSVTRQARALANYEPSMQPVGEWIQARRAGMPERIEDTLNVISEAEAAATGGARLRAGAERVEDAIATARRQVTKPLFEAAEALPDVTDPALIELLENPILQPLVKESQRIVAIERQLPVEQVGPYSVSVLQDVLERLGSKARAAARSNSPDSARVGRDWNVVKNRLEQLVRENVPELTEARVAYREISRAIKNPTDQQLKVITSIRDQQLEKAGESLMKMSAPDITALRAVFAEHGQEGAFKAGVRAYFQNTLDRMTGDFSRNVDVVNRMVGNTQMAQRLEAAVGEREAQVLMDALAMERRMHQGAQALHPGSSTAGNLAEERALVESRNWLGKLFQTARHPLQAADQLVEKATTSRLDDTLANELARIYITDPVRGLAALRAVQRIQAQRYPGIMDASRLEDMLRALGNRAGGTIRSGGGNGGNGGTGSLPTPAPAEEYINKPTALPRQEQLFSSNAAMPALFGLGSGTQMASLFGGTNDTGRADRDAGGTESDKKRDDSVNDYSAIVDELFPRLIKTESNGKEDAVSEKGAVGLAQIMPATYREWAAKLGIKKPNPKDGKQNVRVGKAYLGWLLKQFDGDIPLALAAYNHGIGNVQELQRKHGESIKDIYKKLPRQTREYLVKVTGKEADAFA